MHACMHARLSLIAFKYTNFGQTVETKEGMYILTADNSALCGHGHRDNETEHDSQFEEEGGVSLVRHLDIDEFEGGGR